MLSKLYPHYDYYLLPDLNPFWDYEARINILWGGDYKGRGEEDGLVFQGYRRDVMIGSDGYLENSTCTLDCCWPSFSLRIYTRMWLYDSDQVVRSWPIFPILLARSLCHRWLARYFPLSPTSSISIATQFPPNFYFNNCVFAGPRFLAPSTGISWASEACLEDP